MAKPHSIHDINAAWAFWVTGLEVCDILPVWYVYVYLFNRYDSLSAYIDIPGPHIIQKLILQCITLLQWIVVVPNVSHNICAHLYTSAARPNFWASLLLCVDNVWSTFTLLVFSSVYV